MFRFGQYMSTAGFGVGLADMFVGRSKIDARGLEILVSDLFLDHRQGKFIDMDVVHQMTVPCAMDCEFMQNSAFLIHAVLAIKSGSHDILSKDLTQAVFAITTLGI